MRINIIALGTRGDVQPILALAKGLQAAGHQIKMMAGSNFEAWIVAHGIAFIPTLDIEEMMSSEKGLQWAEQSNNPLQQLRLMRDLLNDNTAAIYHSIEQSVIDADLLISGFTSEPFVHAIHEKFGIPYLSALLQPQPPTRSGTATFLPIVAQGNSVLNRWMGWLQNWMLWQVARDATNRFRDKLGLPSLTALRYEQTKRPHPMIFGFSPQVIAPPSDWPEQTTITGYWFLDEPEVQIPDAVQHFLDTGTPPLYIGFGSMTHRDPMATINLIAAAVRQNQTRAIIGAGWSEIDSRLVPPELLVVRSLPHSWLFQRVAGVIHHGGAGTTAAGLRAGKPTMIVPHMADQPFWGRRLYELGVGVKPIPRHQLNSTNLAAGIRQLLTDTRMQMAAAELGEKIRAERGIANAVEVVATLP